MVGTTKVARQRRDNLDQCILNKSDKSESPSFFRRIGSGN